jgi:hypothetical protein
MLIIWGTKYVYRNLGYVADFCEICRAQKGFLLRRIGLAKHLYFFTTSEGELAGFQRTCETCKTMFQANRDAYIGVCEKAASFEELREKTYPTLPVVMAERLALEEKVKSAPALLTADERKILIRAPFALLAPKVEKQYSAAHLDKEIIFTALGALALVCATPFALRTISRDTAELSIVVLVGIGLLAVMWQFMLSDQRFMRRKIIPVLARSLRPLRPSEAEVRAALDEMQSSNYKMGAKLKLTDLMSHLRSM